MDHKTSYDRHVAPDVGAHTRGGHYKDHHLLMGAQYLQNEPVFDAFYQCAIVPRHASLGVAHSHHNDVQPSTLSATAYHLHELHA